MCQGLLAAWTGLENATLTFYEVHFWQGKLLGLWPGVSQPRGLTIACLLIRVGMVMAMSLLFKSESAHVTYTFTQDHPGQQLCVYIPGKVSSSSLLLYSQKQEDSSKGHLKRTFSYPSGSCIVPNETFSWYECSNDYVTQQHTWAKQGAGTSSELDACLDLHGEGDSWRSALLGSNEPWLPRHETHPVTLPWLLGRWCSFFWLQIWAKASNDALKCVMERVEYV